MASLSISSPMVERYITPLINLSDNIKLEIINRLSASMLYKHNAEHDSHSMLDTPECLNENSIAEDFTSGMNFICSLHAVGGTDVPANEDGKGALAEYKYM